MNAVDFIIEYLQERLGNNYRESEDFLQGIKAYSKDNNMGLFVNTTNEKAICNSRNMVKAFIRSELEMPTEDIVPFFENYKLIQGFKTLSAEIYEAACNKYRGENVRFNDITEDLATLHIDMICYDPKLLRIFEEEISDVKAEIDYIKGKSDKLSKRMKDRVIGQ